MAFRITDTWTCKRCWRAPEGIHHVCASLPPPSEHEMRAADLEHENEMLKAKVVALEKVAEAARRTAGRMMDRDADLVDALNALDAARDPGAE